MGVFRIPDYEERKHFVYAMLCQDGGGPLYVKFGRSSRIGERLTELRIACPIPARYFAIVEVPTKERQGALERELHRRFKDRKITGEWFKFDAKCPKDKQEFNAVSQAAMFAIIGRGGFWDKISVKQLDAYAKQRKAIYMRNKKKIDRKRYRERSQRNAWKELDSFGSS